MLRDVTFSAVLPFATYLLLSGRGVPVPDALAAGALFPLAYAIHGIVRERRVQALAVLVLAATVASIIGAVLFRSAYLALAKGSLITGCVGLAFGASLLLPKPLVYHLAMTGRDADARARSEALWQRERGYRQLMRRMTIVWTVALLAEATLRLILIPFFPVAVFLVVSEAMWIAMFAVLLSWSWRYGRREAAKLLSPAPPSAAAPAR